jgi:DNA-binding transcriptional regulator YiaG
MIATNNLAAQICTLRHKLRLSQEEFAGCLGVTAKTIHRWETNKSNPNALAIATMIKMAKDNRVYDIASAIAPTDNESSRYQHPSNTELVNLRLSLRKTQAEFAEILSVDIKTIQRWERGKTKPSQFYLSQIKQIKQSYPIRSMRLIRV